MFRHILGAVFALLFSTTLALAWDEPTTMEPTELPWSLQAALGLMEPLDQYYPKIAIRGEGAFTVHHVYGDTNPTLDPSAPPIKTQDIIGVAYSLNHHTYYIATNGENSHLYIGNIRSETITHMMSLQGYDATAIGYQGYGDKIIVMTAPTSPKNIRLLAIDHETKQVEELIYSYDQFPDLIKRHGTEPEVQMELMGVEKNTALVREITPGGSPDEGPFYALNLDLMDLHVKRVTIRAIKKDDPA